MQIIDVSNRCIIWFQFKHKKNSDDAPLKIEGLECDEWKVLDMGNIVLHIFDHETRERYNIETLWTVGECIYGCIDFPV